MEKDLYFCGDIHGDLRTLVWKLSECYRIKDSDVLILGDFGVGFSKDLPDIYKRCESKLEKNNLTIYTIRGNHDDPSYFIDPSKNDFPRLKFLEDHKIIELDGRKIYTIGGADSTDIEDRKKHDKKKHKITWWPNESVERKYTDLPTKVDIIVSHTAPISFSPIVERTSDLPLYQYEKILETRKYLDYVLREVNADYWFYGHFHQSFTGTYGKLLYRCLDIMEIFEAPYHINSNPQGKLEEESHE